MAKKPTRTSNTSKTTKKLVKKPLVAAINLHPQHLLDANAAGLSEAELLEIMHAEREHTETTLANPILYPPKHLHLSITDVAAQKLGFLGRGPLSTNLKGLEVDGRDFFPGQGKKNKNKSKKGGNKGGGQGGGKRLPDPKVVFAEVSNAFASLPDAGTTGSVVMLEWNMEFLDPTKAAYFDVTYDLIMRKGHILAGSEVTLKGLQAIAKSASAVHRKEKNLAANTSDRYVAYCGTENSRGQGVGAIIDTDRFEVTKTYEILSVKNVFGIQDLRAAYVMLLTDKTTGKKFRLVIEHLKSMRGGPDATAKVRRKQVELTIADIGNGTPGGQARVKEIKLFDFFKNPVIGRDLSDHGISYVVFEDATNSTSDETLTIITGDMNSKLDSATDVTDVFEAANYWLAGKAGLVGTQQMGPSVLDGTFTDGPTAAYTNSVTEIKC
jgi:hypothetical protein